MRESILERDVSLAGTLNPMLARHGEASQARQYSGRAGAATTGPARSAAAARRVTMTRDPAAQRDAPSGSSAARP